MIFLLICTVPTFWAERILILRILILGFVGYQISGFSDSRIPEFPDFWIFRFPDFYKDGQWGAGRRAERHQGETTASRPSIALGAPALNQSAKRSSARRTRGTKSKKNMQTSKFVLPKMSAES